MGRREARRSLIQHTPFIGPSHVSSSTTQLDLNRVQRPSVMLISLKNSPESQNACLTAIVWSNAYVPLQVLALIPCLEAFDSYHYC